MGLSSSKTESSTKEAGELFSWSRLTKEEQHCHYDPRFEDVAFCAERREVVISTIDNKVLRFALSELQFSALAPVSYSHVRNGNIGRHLDASGRSLAWNEFDATLFYFDICENRMTKLDLSQWAKQRFAGERVWIQQRQMINLGNGVTVFLVGHVPDGGEVSYDLCHFNVEKAEAVSTHPIQFKFGAKNKPEYWGFFYNAKVNCVSVLVKMRESGVLRGFEKTQVLLVSCGDGRVVWQCAFDFIHDLSHSGDGTYMAIFERPKSSFGFVHVLNVSRLSWVCRVKLTYSGLPLGWDGFSWSGDSLVFIAPFKLQVLSESEYNQEYATKALGKAHGDSHSHSHTDAVATSGHLEEDGVVGLDLDEDVDSDMEAKCLDLLTETGESGTLPVAGSSAMEAEAVGGDVSDAAGYGWKRKEICVLGIGSQWWDLEPDVLELMTRLSGDDNVSKLIFEMAALSWTLVQFDFPQIAEDDTTLTHGRTHASEVLKSGVLGEDNYLLLGKLTKDKRTGMYNHWVFFQTRIPRTFKQMWEEVHSADAHYSARLGFVGSQDKEISAK